MLTSFQAPRFHPSQLFTIFMIVLIGSAVFVALHWDFSAKIVPLVVGTVALTGGGDQPVQRDVPQARRRRHRGAGRAGAA